MTPRVASELLHGRRRLHFVGVGGSGMSGIAELCLRLNIEVSGCDVKLGETTRRLSSIGAKIHQGHHPDHLDRAFDAVVISSAIKFSNPEIERARALKIPVVPRAEMLAELLRLSKTGIGVAGTHGKTTTTSLVTLILEEAGFDPTAAIGGNLRARGTNVRLGSGEYMVAEADESDASFLLLLPTIAVVTNIDPEHLDHYGSMEKVEDAFLSFINRVPFYGSAVLGIDSANVRKLLPQVRKNVITYGEAPDADYRGVNIAIDGLSTSFQMFDHGRALGTVTIPSPGKHVALNSMAAIAVALKLGVAFETCVSALRKFSGIARRFEIKGEAAGRLVLDDYAHHPEEVKATLAAAREAFRRRIVAVFQPHRFSRMRDLFDDFLGAFDNADVLYLAEIYPAGEESIPDVSSRRLYEALKNRGHIDLRFLSDDPDPARRIAADSIAGDIIMTLGAGDIFKLGEAVLAELGQVQEVHEPA